MNYFMKDLNHAAAGLLEVPGASQPATPTTGVAINEIVKEMLVSGYDPTRNKAQAITDMERANIPKQVIEQILGMANKGVAERQSQSASAARKEVYTAPVAVPGEEA